MAKRAFGLFAISLALAACSRVEDRYGGPGAGYVDNPATVLRGVDWNQAAAVMVRLDSFDFMPDVVTFRAGRPYRLTLVNESSSGHSFTAPEFFRSIAVYALSGGEGAAPEPDRPLASIALAPGQARRLDFVAVRAGSYRLECDRPLHAAFGMTGTLRIE